MKTYAFARSDGSLLPYTVSLPPDLVELNTPADCTAVTGVTDPLSQRWDHETQSVVDWIPPAPAGDQWRTWQWDPATRRYVQVPTLAAIERDARAERNRRIAATDWTQLPDAPPGAAATWAPYRQLLRDVTDRPGWPHNPDWPVPPA